MTPGRALFLAAGLCAALFLAVGAWMFAVSGQWRLLVAAGLTFVFWVLALWQHRRHIRAAARSPVAARETGLKIDLGARPRGDDAP